ncbi:MAG: hypothetical protein QOH61_1958 [Chloroflexota bacterium]|jgi:hypothetical protein|nr:hypothetical protein [Chloroflexota bacterium]
MTTPRAVRLLLAPVTAFVLAPLVAFVVPSSLAIAASATECERPTLVAFVDPARGSTMEAHVDLHWADLATPAQALVTWGNGEYQTARVDSLQSAARPVAVDARYATAGDYILTVSVTDACGATQVDTLELTVPLSAAPPPAIECPGTLDPSGFCLIPQGERVALRVSGELPESTPLTWRGDRPLAGIDPTVPAASVGLTLPDATAYTLQASARTPDGWVVTKPLTLIGIPRRPDAITVFAAPNTAIAGEPLSLDFEPPAAPVAGVPRIAVDGEQPVDGSSASVTLSAGSHTITYSVAYPDGSSVERQTIVVGREAPVAPATILAGIAGAIGALSALLLIGRRLRHRPARPTGAPPAMPTLPRHRPPASVSATGWVATRTSTPGFAAVARVPRSSEHTSTSGRWSPMRTLRALTVAVVVLAIIIDLRSNS